MLLQAPLLALAQRHSWLGGWRRRSSAAVLFMVLCVAVKDLSHLLQHERHIQMACRMNQHPFLLDLLAGLKASFICSPASFRGFCSGTPHVTCVRLRYGPQSPRLHHPPRRLLRRGVPPNVGFSRRLLETRAVLFQLLKLSLSISSPGFWGAEKRHGTKWTAGKTFWK